MDLPKLDFHKKKKIRLDNIDRPSIRIPLNHVQRKNAEVETMLYNLTKSINVNNISDIDYTAGATNKHPFQYWYSLTKLVKSDFNYY